MFEAIAAVKKRFKIDDKRIMLRGFSQGGEGGWHVALHHPDVFAAAEIGAGTWSRRAEQDLKPWQRPPLEIWEDMEKYALNIFNLPLAGHDGDMDNADQRGERAPGGCRTPNSRGQLEIVLCVHGRNSKKRALRARASRIFCGAKGRRGFF